MRKALFAWFVCTATLFCSTAVAQSSQSLNESADELSNLLQNRQITRIEILHVPDNLQTRTRINPATLRTLSKTKVVVDRPWESSSFDSLRASLQELKNAKSRESGEVRWALVLSDATGKEISSIYLSSDGSLGVFKDTTLALQGRLLSWSKAFIRAAFLARTSTLTSRNNTP